MLFTPFHYNSCIYAIFHLLTPLTIYGTQYNVYNISNRNNYNIEHIVPKSKIKNKNAISDLHLLFIANSKINSLRSNFIFLDEKEIYSKKILYFDKNGFIINKSSYYGIVSFEKKFFIPPFHSRGIIARSLLYYKNEYNQNISNIINENILYEWNNKYGVTKKEIERNIQIYNLQGNKNIFI
jgi:deoxyribonuclease-1